MGSEWRSCRLGDVVQIKTGNPFKSKDYSDASGAVRLLRGDNIVQGTLRWENAKGWHPSRVDEVSDYMLRVGDVVLAMDRPWIEAGLKYAAITPNDTPCLLVQRVACLRSKDDLDQTYLHYLIGSPDFTNYVLGIQTGTAVPHISSGQIQAFPFLLPPLEHQKAAGSILRSLDDKIALLRETNATLEAIAQAIFKSWFVDFDPVRAKAEGRDPVGVPPEVADLFPSEFEDSELGAIPKGWTVSPLDGVADFLNGLAMQKFPVTEGDDWLPVIKIAQLRKGDTEGSDRASLQVPADYVIRDGDVLFSWSGSLEVEIWCSGVGALNQHLFKVTSNRFPKWFFYLWTKHHLPSFREIAANKATTMGHIQRRHLTEAKVVIPPQATLDAISRTIAPLVERTISVALGARTLMSLRDTLLPRLMSGKLRIPDVEEVLA